MIHYLVSHSAGTPIVTKKKLAKDSWVRCEKPTENEIGALVALGLDADIITDALATHTRCRASNKTTMSCILSLECPTSVMSLIVSQRLSCLRSLKITSSPSAETHWDGYGSHLSSVHTLSHLPVRSSCS